MSRSWRRPERKERKLPFEAPFRSLDPQPWAQLHGKLGQVGDGASASVPRALEQLRFINANPSCIWPVCRGFQGCRGSFWR